MKLQKNYTNNLDNLFKAYLNIDNYVKKKRKYKLFNFKIYTHKKLQYFNILYKNKQYNYSNGRLLSYKVKRTKFYKKCRKSIGPSINILNKKFKKKLNKIFFFTCKNFNYRHYLWIKKFFNLIKPKITYFLITHNWNYIVKKRRRIKKKIWKNLFKNSLEI